ncbi:hypothetical protein SEA_GHOBES_18 [Gordonia phage Ghobes]|uniref:Uncharacterized protein n=1 Tax=Gordonia phage Ghobes TaxID=1887647 RepID=A0A1B3B056_9CAUD|nr:hypothetical protein KCH37_gp18 [Gordonia phage Ghobes]AOE44371.1 hypothetical protein SEA_GHOBES_18 [Gordonia phage Ghobes]
MFEALFALVLTLAGPHQAPAHVEVSAAASCVLDTPRGPAPCPPPVVSHGPAAPGGGNDGSTYVKPELPAYEAPSFSAPAEPEEPAEPVDEEEGGVA